MIRESPEKKGTFDENIAKMQKKKTAMYLLAMKCIGDSITASTGSGVLEKLIGRGAGDFWIGIGGSVSAFISCYNLYPKN